MPRLGIRCLLASQQLVRSAVAVLEGLQSGLFMGLLSDRTFRFYDSFPYDEESMSTLAEADMELESWESMLLHTYFRDCQSCLLIAAGGIREMLALLQRDIDVAAVDYSPNLVLASNERLVQEGYAPHIQLAPRYACPTSDHQLQSAIVCRKFYSSILTRAERVQLLQSVHRQLTPGAPLLVSFYSRSWNAMQFQVARAVAIVLRIMTGRRSSIELGNHLDIESPLWHHHFNETEIRSELRQAGFVCEQVEFTWFGQVVARAGQLPSDAVPCHELLEGAV